MITLPLQMRYSEEPLRQAAAWLVSGAQPQTWLDEMLAWGVPLGDAVLYLVPRSSGDLSPQGVLVVLPAGLVPRTTHRSHPYAALSVPARDRQAAGVVYLPVEARIDPAAADDEVAEVAGDEGDCMLHPTVGRIRLEAGDQRHVVDLLAPPPQRPARWDLAEPGQYVNSRLTAIVPAEVPSLEQILDQGRGDIGSEPPTLDELPPEPDEPSPGLVSKLGRGLERGLARMIEKLAGAGDAAKPRPAEPKKGSSAGKAPGKSGLFSKMADWSRRKMAQFDESLRKNRHRELHRLMRLLQNDPDRGLRFALPCGEGKHRGVARPSDTLPSRNVNFDLRRLGGGTPGDPWELPGDLYALLRAKYVELAEREMRLGRYRRAAYVYAHLLGDFHHGAAALIQGRHWREAAVLYRDHLDQPDEAARCLEQGGLWTEAIELYQRLGRFEKVGDLYAQLEQPEQAESAWRRAVKGLLDDRDILAAARLLETKLKVHDEALARLAEGWPQSPQAVRCLGEQIALLARLGRHEATAERIQELRGQTVGETLRPVLLDVLVENARCYPQDAVRTLAADATRAIVARHLREASGPDLDRLLNCLRKLVPADRLLDRDCARYHRIHG
jgi:tetratricopeptide (TPR) repeat protein